MDAAAAGPSWPGPRRVGGRPRPPLPTPSRAPRPTPSADLAAAARRRGGRRGRQSAVAAADAWVSGGAGRLGALPATEPRSVSRRPTPRGVSERFVDVEHFVAQFLSPVVAAHWVAGPCGARSGGTTPRRPNRLWALWRGVRGGPASRKAARMSAWWVYHVDAHLAVLLGRTGPFWECRKGRHTSAPGLPARARTRGVVGRCSADLDTPVAVRVPTERQRTGQVHDEERSRP